MQIDLIDMQSRPDGDYKYIGHFVDHFTKYHVLFAMKSKSANIVASNLVQPQYRVLTPYGLIKDVLTASDLNEYAGTMTSQLDVSTWESSPQISLQKTSEKYNHRDQCKAAIKSSVRMYYHLNAYVYASMNYVHASLESR